jgi:CxxC motif-containing protein
MNTRELICIGCPMGCQLSVKIKEDKVVEVTGNTCKNGKEYGEKECTNPTRIVTSSVYVEGGEIDVLSVKTERDIPKDKVFDCIKLLKGKIVKAPINIGDVIVENVVNLGINIIATKNVKRSKRT